jgi:DNA-binding transcriptional LysR family regulator
MLPSWYFTDELETGKVRVILRDWQVPGIPVHIIYPSRRYLSPRVRAVMDFLLAEFSSESMFAGEREIR